MGVMPCYREGCDSTLCDTYINEGDVGYICSGCISEFKKTVGEQELTKKEIILKLQEFMKTSKITSNTVEKMSVDEFFEK